MYRNYLKVAFRNIIKHKAFSAINIFGLAVGMSVCMTIIMLVADQMMNDQYNPDKERIFRVNAVPYYNGNKQQRGNETATTALPLRDQLINGYSGVESAVRIMRGFGNQWLEIEPGHDINIPISGFFADHGVLDLFHINLLYGDKATALKEPFSVVLTEKAARKLFRKENPVGETFAVGKLGTYTVTGVMKDEGNKSHIYTEAYASMASVGSLQSAGILTKENESWYNYYTGWLYIRLTEGASPDALQAHLDKVANDTYKELPTPETVAATFKLQNLVNITPGALINNPIGPFMPWVIIYFACGLAGIILVTSCFNFTNLSIARSLKRAKEIGIRKVTGAVRMQIFNQFISESILIALLSLVLAIMILFFLKPLIEQLAFVEVMKWSLSANGLIYGIFVVFAVVVGLFAGFFPAVVLSGFQPIKVLKKLDNTKLFSRMGLRKTLLTVQFTISLIFILTVIVLYNQLNLHLKSDPGFDPKQKVIVKKGETDIDILKNELLKSSSISNVSLASHLPLSGITYADDFKRNRLDKEWIKLNYFVVDEDYAANMKLKLLAGNFISPENGASLQNQIVLNEEALKVFAFESAHEALGETVFMHSDSTEKKIVGILKNYHFEMMANKLEPMALIYNRDQLSMAQVAYTGTLEEAKKAIEQSWANINPNLKVEVLDFEKEMNSLYEVLFGSLVRIVGFIALLAIIISSLGLLGMATYTVETRRKEIALRKVLGCNTSGMIYILSRGYVTILIIAVLVATPLAYFLNTFWLQQFAMHTTVDFVTITTGILILGFFAALAVSSQVTQALYVNPVDNLKED